MFAAFEFKHLRNAYGFRKSNVYVANASAASQEVNKKCQYYEQFPDSLRWGKKWTNVFRNQWVRKEQRFSRILKS